MDLLLKPECCATNTSTSAADIARSRSSALVQPRAGKEDNDALGAVGSIGAAMGDVEGDVSAASTMLNPFKALTAVRLYLSIAKYWSAVPNPGTFDDAVAVRSQVVEDGSEELGRPIVCSSTTMICVNTPMLRVFISKVWAFGSQIDSSTIQVSFVDFGATN